MKTILVIEDFLAVQQLLRETLESKGYKTLGASNGNKAYVMLVNHAHRISLVLTDYHMPDVTGIELIKRIRENPELEKIPVIFLTEESGSEIIQLTQSPGFNFWIKKPYRPEVLFEEIKNAISN